MCGRESFLGIHAHMFLCFIIITRVSSLTAPVCCFDCVYDVLKQMANVVQHTRVAKVIVGFHFVGFASSFSSLSAPASMG